MTSCFMLDTDVVINVLRGYPSEDVRQFERLILSDLCISALTAAELVYGAMRRRDDPGGRQRTSEFLRGIAVLDWPAAAVQPFADTKRHLTDAGQMIGEMDLLIAAHALAAHLPLVTGNMRHFGRVPGLTVVDWRDGALGRSFEDKPPPD
jgi:tRNA(fMet)-specific endonuclease VapC